MLRKSYLFVLSLAVLLALAGCGFFTNFTTYFNTYYNMERLMKEAENEFSYFDEKLRVRPRTLVPEREIFFTTEGTTGVPTFLEDIVIRQQKRQPVAVKLDSILIKGSKILAKAPKSDYVEGSLYLMAKSYFYREEWLPSQIKCSELIDLFPNGKLVTDAHLLWAKDLLIQKKYYEGKVMLSRTVDVAWRQKRYDILSEAFRLQAELALYQNDSEGAERPYRQAISQTEDDEVKAKWQLDLASLLFRINKFEKAEKEYQKVLDYDPDYLGLFESQLYRAASLQRLKRYEEANEILDDLYSDGKFSEWKSYIEIERTTALRLKSKDSSYKYSKMGMQDTTKNFETAMVSSEKFLDTAYVGNDMVLIYQYERGMDAYENSDYMKALKYFAKSRTKRTPAYQTSFVLYKYLSDWRQFTSEAFPALVKLEKGENMGDTSRAALAQNLYEIGRIHENLNHKDSVEHYFSLAVKVAPSKNPMTAKYIYNKARVFREKDPMMADSLMEVLADNYALTDYGEEAMKYLGKTEQFLIDTAADHYASGVKLRRFKEFNLAINQFSKVYIDFPKHNLAPRSIYSIAYTFEKDIINYDSAYYYYSMLIAKYPQSEFAKDLQLGIAYFQAKKDGKELPDSLQRKAKMQPINPTDRNMVIQPMDSTANMQQKLPMDKAPSTNPLENWKKFSPENLLKQGKETINQSIEDIKNIDLTDPTKLLLPPSQNPQESLPDSTKSNIPPKE